MFVSVNYLDTFIYFSFIIFIYLIFICEPRKEDIILVHTHAARHEGGRQLQRGEVDVGGEHPEPVLSVYHYLYNI